MIPYRPFVLAAVGVFASANALCAGVLVNFDDLSLSPESYHNDSAFSSSGVGFNNDYADYGTYTSWGGFAYSNVTDTTTPDFTNQYAAITGTGVGSSNYGVAYVDTYTPTLPTITLPGGVDQPLSITLTNTVYVYYTIRDGNGFANAFEQGDYFKLTLSAFAADGSTLLGSLDFYLADFRSLNPAEHYILDEWTSVDLSSFGAGVKTLSFELESTDVGAFGTNTPTYFAVGQLVAVPEPNLALAGLLLGLGLVCVRRFQYA